MGFTVSLTANKTMFLFGSRIVSSNSAYCPEPPFPLAA